MLRGPGRALGERGSVLMLMPAAVLVVVVLSAVTVDVAVVHLARRELVMAAEAAANDAATRGLDERSLRAGAGVRLDGDRVLAAVEASLRARGAWADLAEPPVVRVEGGTDVRVELVSDAAHVFARAVPGAAGATRVRAAATASADRR